MRKGFGTYMEKITEKMRAVINAGTKKESMLVLFLCGILLFVIFLPTENNSKNSSSYQNNRNDAENEQALYDNISYKESLETELKQFLESVSGVGEARVLIYVGDEDEGAVGINGVVVAAKGASNENVRLNILKLVMALYGIDANMVEVTALE
jgi:hypothetical protein